MKNYSFKVKPFDHQLESLGKVEEPFRALFCDMGTGKSKILVDTIAYLYGKGEIRGALILPPKTVAHDWVHKHFQMNWPDELDALICQWSPFPSKAEINGLHSIINKDEQKCRIFVMNIEALSSSKGIVFSQRFANTFPQRDLLVAVDESTTIKSNNSTRSRSAVKLSKMANYRRILSGRPTPKNSLDLFMQGRFLNSEDNPFGPTLYSDFMQEYANITEAYGSGGRRFKKITGFKNMDKLKEYVAACSDVINKNDCLDLPKKTYEILRVEMTPVQKELYNKIAEGYMAEFLHAKMSYTHALTRIIRLHQISCGYFVSNVDGIRDIPNNRDKILVETLDGLSGKTIVWANYVYNIERLSRIIEEKFGQDSFVSLYGALSEGQRWENLDRFKSSDSCKFLIATQATGAWGLNLVEAKNAVYFANSYNLEHRIQSEDRIHRIGQAENVLYVDLCTPKTVDERILEVLKTKNKLSDIILNREEYKSWLLPA